MGRAYPRPAAARDRRIRQRWSVALQDAASIAGLLITREAMVAEAPKRDRRRTGYDLAFPSTDAFAAAAPHILAA